MRWVVALAALCACGGRTVSSALPSDAGADSTVDAATYNGGTASCPHADVVARCKNRECLVPAGCFFMGSPPDEPGRGMYTEPLTEVEYTYSLAVGQYEVTQGEWVAAGLENRAGTITGQGFIAECLAADCPASTMTWYEAVEYTNRLSKRAGLAPCMELPDDRTCGDAGPTACEPARPTFTPYWSCPGYRLATSGEFEYAARAGERRALPGGDLTSLSEECFELPFLSEVAWYCANSGNRTHPVGRLKPNGWGLFDMVGNALEWGAEGDPFEGYGDRPGAHVVDPAWNSGVVGKVFQTARGGIGSMPPKYQRLASIGYGGTRLASGPGGGLRVVRTLTKEQVAGW